MLRLVLACLALCFSYNIALAKYCVKLPSCEDLGYVFPYKEGRRQIRCPFDTDKTLYLDYCQAYGIQGKPDEKAGEYQECIEEKADGTKINTGYYRYTRCNVGYFYENGTCRTYQVGDIYYNNGTPIGVVFFDDGTTTKIVALNDIDNNGIASNGYHTPWTTPNSSDYYDIPNLTNYTSESTALTDMDGKSNTSTILSYASANGKTVQAATATSKYAPNVCDSSTFCGRGEWYLPALGELYTISKNFRAIQNSITSAGGTKIITGSYYSSSTEVSYNCTWGMSLEATRSLNYYKYSGLIIRPVLAF